MAHGRVRRAPNRAATVPQRPGIRPRHPATLVLPSGTVLDTAAPDAEDRLRALEPELYPGCPGCASGCGNTQMPLAAVGEPGGEAVYAWRSLDAYAGPVVVTVSSATGNPGIPTRRRHRHCGHAQAAGCAGYGCAAYGCAQIAPMRSQG
jgi:hypothetical protein